MTDDTIQPISQEERERRRAEEQRLNDLARTKMGEAGRLMVTPGILELDLIDRRTLRRAIEKFDRWEDGDDPYGLHDFGCLYGKGERGSVQWSAEAEDTEENPFVGFRVFWKVDVYAPDMEHGAEEPWKEDGSVRVLTIMRASEY